MEEENTVKIWIVGVVDTQYGLSAIRVTGTKGEIVSYLAGMAAENSHISDSWCEGTTQEKDVVEEDNGTLVAYSRFYDDSKVTYFACEDSCPHNLDEKANLVKENV